MLVEDLITRSPVTLGPEDTLADAAERMRESDVGSVVVVDEGTPVGILTDRDIALYMAGGVEDEKVDLVMTPRPLCVGNDTDVESCLERMEDRGVRRILVLDEDERLVGVVSLDDILIHMSAVLDRAASLVRKEIVTR